MTTPPDLHVVEQRGSAADAGPLVVIVHGAMDRGSSFGRVARQLDDLHLVRYDRRGYGRSAGVAVGTLADHVADLLAVVGDRRAVVFGHSIGGVVALVAAEHRPDLVRSVLAYEAPTPWVPWWPQPGEERPADPADEAEAFLRGALGDRLWSRLPARTRADRRSEGAALRADVDSLQGGPVFDPSSIAVPVLCASGSETSWWHARATSELAEALPDADHAVIEGAQHGAHFTHPTATGQLVRRAIASATW